MKTPEQRFREKPADIQEAAYQRAEQVLDEKKKGRTMKDFIGKASYTAERVGEIIDKVAKAEAEFQKEVSTLAGHVQEKIEKVQRITKCLEGIILSVNSWFGPTSEVYPTTRWDSIHNGVDLVVERTKDDAKNHHGFALDIMFARANKILDKIKNIAEKLHKGELGRVDFFKSPDGIESHLAEIPLVVIGADEYTMKDLMTLFADHEDEKVESHPVQFQFIDQVIAQCELFMNIADKIEDAKISERVKGAYQKLKDDFEKIIKTKKTLGETEDTGERDTFHEDLMEVIKAFQY